MDQAPDFSRCISLRPPAAIVGPFPCSAPSLRPPPGSTHSQNSRKSLEASRRTETASTPRPSSALGRISAPHPRRPPPVLPQRPPTHPGFPDCQKPELEPVAGQFLSLEAGRTPILAIPGLASNPFSPGITFSSARRSLLLGI